MEKRNEELKPCPVCGGDGRIRTLFLDRKPGRYYVQCRKCGVKTEYYINKRRAVSIWNRIAEKNEEK